jgi:hypothetical protein
MGHGLEYVGADDPEPPSSVAKPRHPVTKWWSRETAGGVWST